MTHPHDNPVRAELQSLDQQRADRLADALRPVALTDDTPTPETWRVVDTRGATQTVTVARINDALPRWRITHHTVSVQVEPNGSNASTDPREALCRWAGYEVEEIRGPGEATTAEQLAARDAEIARLVSVCDDLQTAWLTASAERDAALDQLAAVTADAHAAEQERDAAEAIIAGRTTLICDGCGQTQDPRATRCADCLCGTLVEGVRRG